MILRTERLLLRRPQASDLDAWTTFFLSERGRWVGGGTEHDAGRAWRAYASLIGHWDIHGFGSFVIENRTTGQPLGIVGPWFPALWPEREIGWSCWSPADEGTGVMGEAAREVLRHVFHDLGWGTAVSYIDPANVRSVALARRLGAAEDPSADRVHPDDLVFRHAPDRMDGKKTPRRPEGDTE